MDQNLVKLVRGEDEEGTKMKTSSRIRKCSSLHNRDVGLRRDGKSYHENDALGRQGKLIVRGGREEEVS